MGYAMIHTGMTEAAGQFAKHKSNLTPTQYYRAADRSDVIKTILEPRPLIRISIHYQLLLMLTTSVTIGSVPSRKRPAFLIGPVVEGDLVGVVPARV